MPYSDRQNLAESKIGTSSVFRGLNLENQSVQSCREHFAGTVGDRMWFCIPWTMIMPPGGVTRSSEDGLPTSGGWAHILRRVFIVAVKGADALNRKTGLS